MEPPKNGRLFKAISSLAAKQKESMEVLTPFPKNAASKFRMTTREDCGKLLYVLYVLYAAVITCTGSDGRRCAMLGGRVSCLIFQCFIYHIRIYPHHLGAHELPALLIVLFAIFVGQYQYHVLWLQVYIPYLEIDLRSAEQLPTEPGARDSEI